MPGANPSGGGFSWGTLANRPAPNVGISLYIAIDNGQSYWSDGANWHAMGSNDIPVVMTSGQYYIPSSPQTTSTTVMAGGTLRACPIAIPHDLTLSRIGGEVTVAGDAGSTVRLGIYADTGAGYPGALVLDAGTIAGDSVSVQEIVINQPLTAGLFWLATATQGAPVTSPAVRTLSSNTGIVAPSSPTIPIVGATHGGYSSGGFPGALPGAFPAGLAAVGSIPRLFIKVA
jgi:hypothetical protein